MKKNGKGSAKRPSAPAKPAGESKVSRNRKIYEGRLEDLGLTQTPVAAAAKVPSHADLAQMAAALAKDSAGALSAGELVGRASEIWNATTSATEVGEMSAFIVKGLCVFNEEDWQKHCHSLVRLFDESRGAIPGHISKEQLEASSKRAQVKGGAALVHLWRGKPVSERGAEVIRSLFPAKSETEETRCKKLITLLEFAKRKVDHSNNFDWRDLHAERLTASLRDAWSPLDMSSEEVNSIQLAADVWLLRPGTVKVANLGAFAVLARWLAVMRMQQMSEAKSR
jgi:hypothetical protein